MVWTPSQVVFDEAHAIKNRNLYGVLVIAFGSNEGSEYLFSVITTAGFILDGLCTDLYKNGAAVLNKRIVQDNYFYCIFELDKEDDWSDEKAWYKSNPALIYGRPSIQYVRDRYAEATLSFAEKANFITKHCNLFVNGIDKWLDLAKVQLCAHPEMRFEAHKHRKCYMGFDRSLGGDITSCYVIFTDDDGGITIFGFNLQTQAAIKGSTDYLQKIYEKAEALGHLKIITSSARIRNEHVKNMIREVYKQLPLCEHIAYDPFKMKECAMDLEDEGYPMLAVSQGPSNLSEPAKKFESLVEDQLLRYNGDTLFEFACECAVMDLTKFNNAAVYKEDYKNEKIDPLIATIIALSSATLFSTNTSVYNHKRLLQL
jgi:phage terminase large subunit-like protein